MFKGSIMSKTKWEIVRRDDTWWFLGRAMRDATVPHCALFPRGWNMLDHIFQPKPVPVWDCAMQALRLWDLSKDWDWEGCWDFTCSGGVFFLIPDILLSFQPEIEHLIKFQKYSGCMVDAHLWGHQCKTSRSEYVVGPWGHVDSCFTVIDFTSGVCWCLKGVGV